jgi:tetratricopeptide (TPR) repeat protein
MALFLLAGALGAQDLPLGRIIDKVVCRDKPDQSYALFIPADYAPGKKWPVIFAFDPGANGRVAVERFQEAAERFHLVVAASNNARNGPWKPIIDAAWAMWADSEGRLSLDDKRIYAAGFSGGSRAASLFAWMIGRPVAGVVGCGAGLAPETGLGDVIPVSYYGIVGTADFNYREMKKLDGELASKNIPHWIEIIEGGHEWPPASECTHAVAWLQMLAMRGNAVPRDESQIDSVYAAETERAAGLEMTGDACGAARRYRKIADLFIGLRETETPAAAAARLGESPACRKLRKDEEARDRREESGLAEFDRVFAAVDGSGRIDQGGLNARLAGLEEDAAKSADPADRVLAARLLHGLADQAGRKGLVYHAEGSFRKAIACFEIASRASEVDDPRHKFNLYNLACALARSGNPGEALKNLKLAVDRGLDDKTLFLTDKDLDSLRQKPEFREILDRLGSNESR